MVNINAYFKKSLKILWHNFFRFSLILFFSSSIIFFIWIFLIHRSTWKEVFLIGNLWVTYLPENQNQIFFLFVYDWPFTILSYSDVFLNYYYFFMIFNFSRMNLPNMKQMMVWDLLFKTLSWALIHYWRV